MNRECRVIGQSCVVVLFATFAQSALASDSDQPATSKQEPTVSHISEVAYLTPEVGVEYVGLESLHLTRELFPSQVHSADVGPVVGVGAGVRLLFVTLGPRFRFGHFRDWDLWTLDAEVGFKAPLGAVEPFIGLGAGYARVGRL